MMEKEDFFNEENIQRIDPLLYYIYIGKYKRRGNTRSRARVSMADISFHQLDKINYEQLLLQKYDEYYEQNNQWYFEGAEEEGIENDEEIDPSLLEDNEDELIRVIMAKFLNGELDKFVDYDLIDTSTKYDNIKLIQNDKEDKYFDSEEPSVAPKDSIYTGVLDY